MNTSRFLHTLLGIYGVLFAVAAINPTDRSIWFAENLTIWIILGIIMFLYLRKVIFSKTAYALMFVLVYLHTIGGHYTFALVPFDYVTNFFDFDRNHFDRIAHFSVGFYAFAMAELLYVKGLVKSKIILFTYPIFFIATIAAGFRGMRIATRSSSPTPHERR